MKIYHHKMTNVWDHVVDFKVLSVSNVLLTLLLLIVIWKVFCLLFYQQSSAPGPKGLPIIGNLLELRNTDLLVPLRKWERTYGPIVQFRPFGIFGKSDFLRAFRLLT